ncbi:MAG: HXXEE domain-containing protein [Bacteroidota bacterium]|nr:HXXEE domain-containing protein [Bacteroidota bacterium]
MKIETLLWLLPIVFMFHDFEEIIMMKAWLDKNADKVASQFPFISKLLFKQKNLSTAAFALEVAEEFIIISIITFFAVEWDLYSLWTGLLLVFFIHLILHVVQFIVYRKYVPVIITSILSIPYCIYAIISISGYVNWTTVLFLSPILLVAVILNLRFCFWLGEKFQKILEPH